MLHKTVKHLLNIFKIFFKIIFFKEVHTLPISFRQGHQIINVVHHC